MSRLITSMVAILVVGGFIATSANAAYVLAPGYASYEGDVAPAPGWNVSAGTGSSAASDGDILTISGGTGAYTMAVNTSTAAQWDASAGNFAVEFRIAYQKGSASSDAGWIIIGDGADFWEIRMHQAIEGDRLEDKVGNPASYGAWLTPGFHTYQFVFRPYDNTTAYEVYVDGVLYTSVTNVPWSFDAAHLANSTSNNMFSFSLRGSSTPNSVQIDYIRWGSILIPEPASLMLMALGAGLMGLRGRR